MSLEKVQHYTHKQLLNWMLWMGRDQFSSYFCISAIN